VELHVSSPQFLAHHYHRIPQVCAAVIVGPARINNPGYLAVFRGQISAPLELAPPDFDQPFFGSNAVYHLTR